MTGGAVHATDPTNASRTLLYRSDRLDRLGFDDGLLDLFEVPRGAAARGAPLVRRLRHDARRAAACPTASRSSASRATSRRPSTARAARRPGAIKNTYGTGCFLMAYTGPKRVASKHGLLTTVACAADGAPAYALEGAVFIAGAAVQWLRDALGVIAHAGETEALARSRARHGAARRSCPRSSGWARRTGTPTRAAPGSASRAAPGARTWRAPCSSRSPGRRATWSRRWSTTARRAPRALRVDGGAAANGFLCRCRPTSLGVPVERPRMVETTALGAGLLAARALGWSDAGRAAQAAEKTSGPRGDAGSERRPAARRWNAAIDLVRGRRRGMTVQARWILPALVGLALLAR